MASARFKLNGTNNASVANPLSPDTGSGYRLVPGGTTIIYTTSQAYEGTASLTGNGTDYVYVDNGSGTYLTGAETVYVDFFWRCSSLPGADTMLIGSVYVGEAGAYISSDGRIRFKDDGGVNRGQSSASLIAANTWYRIRAKFTGSGLAEIYVWSSNFTQDNPSGYATQVTPSPATGLAYMTIGGPVPSSFYYDDIVIAPTADGNTTHTSATTHSGAAALSTTATLTATANSSRTAAAALSATSAITPAAALARPLDAAVSTTATLTATATRTAMVDAALSTTATLTATMTVTPPAGTHNADAALSTTGTLTAAAALERFADVALSTTATLTATAGLDRPLAAALSTTATLTATMIIEGQVPTTVGFMRPATMSAATIRPRGGVTAPTIAALVSIDTATMTAVVSTSIPGSRYGVPVFVGGTDDPVTEGLIAAGLAYVWFADDGIHVVEAS